MPYRRAPRGAPKKTNAHAHLQSLQSPSKKHPPTSTSSFFSDLLFLTAFLGASQQVEFKNTTKHFFKVDV
jgi:hypothetical protein